MMFAHDLAHEKPIYTSAIHHPHTKKNKYRMINVQCSMHQAILISQLLLVLNIECIGCVERESFHWNLDCRKILSEEKNEQRKKKELIKSLPKAKSSKMDCKTIFDFIEIKKKKLLLKRRRRPIFECFEASNRLRYSFLFLISLGKFEDLLNLESIWLCAPERMANGDFKIEREQVFIMDTV